MPVVIVDAPAITLTLVGPVSPQSVQIAIAGLTPGMSIVVTGQAGTYTWSVRGGTTTIAAAQLILTDAATPINVPCTYTVTVEGVPFVAGPITVPYADDTHVLQSLDGRTVIPFRWMDNADPRTMDMRVVSFAIPGRPDPVVRYDVTAGESGELRIRTTMAVTALLRTHMRTESPVLVARTDGTIRDLAAVAYVLLTGVSNDLWEGVEDRTARVWTLRFDAITDPDPYSVLPSSTWDDFDTVWAALTWDDFDLEEAGITWDDFDRIDWTNA